MIIPGKMIAGNPVKWPNTPPDKQPIKKKPIINACLFKPCRNSIERVFGLK